MDSQMDQILAALAQAPDSDAKKDIQTRLGVPDSVMNLTPPKDANSVPSSFNVQTSDTTVPMTGNLPSVQAPAPVTTLPPLPSDNTSNISSTTQPTATPSVLSKEPNVLPKSTPSIQNIKTPEVSNVIPSSNDNDARNAMMAQAIQNRKNATLPIAIAGAGDAIATALKAKGLNVPTDEQDKLVALAKQNFEESQGLFETKLQNDPNSDISKSYRDMVTQIAPALAKDPNFQNMSAKAIGDKLPLIDTMMKAKASEDARKAALAQTAAMRDITLGTKQEQFDQHEWDKIVKDTNPETASRRTSLGIATVANNNIDRALTALSKPMLTQQEASNVMADVASIYQQGSPTQFGMQHQAYNTLYGKVKEGLQYLSGKPQDAVPDAIKQRLIGTLNDLKNVNSSVINRNMDYIEKAQPKLIASHNKEWNDMRDSFRGNQQNQPTPSQYDPLGLR